MGQQCLLRTYRGSSTPSFVEKERRVREIRRLHLLRKAKILPKEVS